MEIIKWKLDKITEVWNHYFWEYKTLQKKINFNSEVKTNYYGEILSYLNDTFDFLALNTETDLKSNIFHYTGLLQIIYVQQDLIDELLHIFKLQASSLADKKPNREIRNELIGHPIRRNKKGNELISSVIFSNYTSNTLLQYLIYSKTNNFKMEERSYTTQKILDSHYAFLNKYFNQILNKISKILIDREKKLAEFETSLTKNISLERIINQTESIFEFILKYNYLYKKSHLLECNRRKDEHPRYNFAIEIFLDELRLHLAESRVNIKDFIEELKNGPKKYEPFTNINPIELFFNKISSKKFKKIKKDYTYELGKLHEKHPAFTIDYFKRSFPKNKKILCELENMERNYNNELEFYCSYEYLSKLILKKKYKS